MQGRAKGLTIIGLILTLIGAGSATYGVWLSPDKAVEAGVSSLFAMAGFILIGFGTLLQIGGAAIQRHQQDAENEFGFQRKQIRAAWSLNRITLSAAVVALGGLVILFFTLRENHKAMIEDHRAWIAVRTPIFHIAPPPKNPGDLFQIAVSYENIGKEPALNVSKAQGPFWITDFVPGSNSFELNMPPNNTCAEVNTKINMGPVWPGTKPDLSRGPAFQITADAAFLNIKTILGYHGCFIYETFQEPHRTGYCFFLTPVVAHPVAEWLWDMCPGADQNFAD